MKKSTRIKGLLAIGFAAMLSIGIAAGCAPKSASEGSSPQAEVSTEATADAGAESTGGGAIDMAAYPNHVENSSDGAGLASFHVALGQDCASCHTGDFEAQVAALATEGEPELGSTYYMDSETCLACHGGTWEALAETTSDLGDYNPHDGIHGTIENCNECHKGHRAQQDICSECHDNGGQTMKGNN